jgi:hypothetical protein
VLATVIAAGLSLLSPLLGVGFFVIGVLLIWLVGYLIPGTPSLTKRYLPRRVLLWFGKEPAYEVFDATDETLDRDTAEERQEMDIDVDWLVDIGVLTAEVDDSLAINPTFEERWTTSMDALRNQEDDQREAFADIVEVAAKDVKFEDVKQTGAFTVRVDGYDVSQWISKAAFLADLAADVTLTNLDDDWTSLSLQKRHKLLVGLRQFLDACPGCGGTLVEDVEMIDSCCGSANAVTAKCEECESRMYVVTGE